MSAAFLLIRKRITAQAPLAPVSAPAAAPRSESVSLVIRFAFRSGDHGRPLALAIVFLDDIDMPWIVRQFFTANHREREQLEMRAASLYRTPEMRSGHGAIGSVHTLEIAFRRKLESRVTQSRLLTGVMAPGPIPLTYFVSSF